MITPEDILAEARGHLAEIPPAISRFIGLDLLPAAEFFDPLMVGVGAAAMQDLDCAIALAVAIATLETGQRPGIVGAGTCADLHALSRRMRRATASEPAQLPGLEDALEVAAEVFEAGATPPPPATQPLLRSCLADLIRDVAAAIRITSDADENRRLWTERVWQAAGEYDLPVVAPAA